MAENTEATMDMDAHRKSYEGFIHLTILTTVFCISIVIMLAIGATGSWGLAGFGVFLAIIASIVGLLMNGSTIPMVVITLGVLGLKLLFG